MADTAVITQAFLEVFVEPSPPAFVVTQAFLEVLVDAGVLGDGAGTLTTTVAATGTVLPPPITGAGAAAIGLQVAGAGEVEVPEALGNPGTTNKGSFGLGIRPFGF